jgi:aconitate hydratase
MTTHDSFGARAALQHGGETLTYYRLGALAEAGLPDPARLPYSIRVLLENLLRHEDGETVTRSDIEAVARFEPGAGADTELAFRPARVLLQDFTGVPALVDLAAMRERLAELGGDAARINPLLQSDLVIDHSVQVDSWGLLRSFADNVAREFERNEERYRFLKWGQQAFAGMRVVPPGTGIVHQVNLEYLAPVLCVREQDGQLLAYPDSLVGTDSHTTMINGLGVFGWGVGGIEAEAAMLGEPIGLLLPEVIGFRLSGALAPGATATDVVLTVTERLRARGVVGKFVEFFGPGMTALSIADRATIANMAPEYGATMGFFPVDARTLEYLAGTGREPAHVERVERVLRAQGLFHDATAPEPQFGEALTLNLAEVVPCLAGPRRPQDRIALSDSKAAWQRDRPSFEVPEPVRRVRVERGADSFELTDGDVAIAAITSCTNTSNPSVMLAAGLVARAARQSGLKVKPWVKTSLAPGSQVVTEYLRQSDLITDLEALGFFVVGYGCTTCIGNSGPLDEPIAEAVRAHGLVLASVLSGNRNFEGRVNPLTRANYLASPPLVVAYALAGTLDIDLTREPLGNGPEGQPVYLADLWPNEATLQALVASVVRREQFEARYAHVLEGPDAWQKLEVATGQRYLWQPDSTYIRRAPFFDDVQLVAPPALGEIQGARVLCLLGDSVTTDHISPAGSIATDSAAADYLREHGVAPRDFNSYGSRRGNHEVMVRGTFGNIRLKNRLAPGTEGPVTRVQPEDAPARIHDAAVRYASRGVPLLVIAGKEYGAGSSRDWAAKGTRLLGVRAVLAESYERIHRSNLVGMGVLPLEFLPGESAASLGLTGRESYDVTGIAEGLAPGKRLQVVTDTGRRFEVRARIDTARELEYLRDGGIMQYVLRRLARA